MRKYDVDGYRITITTTTTTKKKYNKQTIHNHGE